MTRRNHPRALSLGSALVALSVAATSSLRAAPIAVDLVTAYTGTTGADLIGSSLPDPLNASATAAATRTGLVPLLGDGTVDARTTATAGATGIDALAGADALDLSARINALAGATARGTTASGSLLGTATVDVGVSAAATAEGVDAGADGDRIDSSEAVTAGADAQATGVAVAVTIDGSLFGDAQTGSALINGATRSTAASVALGGGRGDDKATNRGDLAANAMARTTAVTAGISIGIARDGNVSVAGGLSDASSLAKAMATGIAGGDGADTLQSLAGQLMLNATARSTAVSVTLGISGSLAGDVTAGPALSDSSATAAAWATGLLGGAGRDTLVNWSPVLGAALAEGTSVGVTVGITLANEGSVSDSALSDASVAAGATAVGIDAGAGGGTITNSGALSLRSDAQATGVAVGLAVTGDVTYEAGKGESDGGDGQPTPAPTDGEDGDDTPSKVSGQALSKATTTAAATTVGILGGDGVDTIVNTSAGVLPDLGVPNALAHAVGLAASLNLAAGVGINTDAKLEVSGAAVSDVRVTASALAAAIEGGAGDDAITNQAGISRLWADATATGVAVGLNISGSLAYKGDVSGKVAGEAMSDASTLADARAVALSGGDGNDTLVNAAALGEIRATSSAVAVAAALGVTAGLAIEGDAKDFEVSGKAVSDASVTSRATAIGLDGGAGRDDLQNGAGISSILAESDATGVAVSLEIAGTLAYKGEAASTVAGEAVSKTSVNAGAVATGIAGGDGGGSILNTEDLASVRATADATSVGVGLSISGQVAYSEPEDDGASGDDGDSGDSAGTDDGEDGDGIKGSVVSDARAVATARVTGIGGGSGVDTIDNQGGITSSTVADATAVAVTLGAPFNVGIEVTADGDVSGMSLSDASVEGGATTVGIDAGAGGGTITNSGALSVKSDAQATGVAVGLTIAGNVSYKKGDDESEDGDGQPTPAPTGGEDGDDTPSKVSGQALSKATTTAAATTVGILGGDGADTIVNTSAGVLPDLGVPNALAHAVGVAASLNLAAGVGINTDAKLDVSGAAVSDVRVTASALAAALEGGAGNDSITNQAAINRWWADATATGVAVGLNISGSLAYEGDVSGKVAGEAMSDASSLADARAVALSGGDGNDTLVNEAALDEIKATSLAVSVATALGVDAGLAIKGDAEKVEVSGRAVSDASVTSSATAIALEGGAGDGTVHNKATIAAILAESDATGVAASLEIAGTLSYKGDTEASVAGQAVSNTSVSSRALAAAIAGGEGIDVLKNDALIASVISRANAVGVAAALGVSVSVAVEGDAKATVEGGALSNGSVLADATTVGVDGGAGNDQIYNTGDLSWLESVADTVGVAAGLNLSAVVTVKGDSEADVSGDALSDTSALARATTVALSGGGGNDRIDNSGTLNLLAGADATGIAAALNVSAAVTFKGTQEADVTGSAASDASVTALATATGIDGGAGEDTIVNRGAITLMNGTGVDAYALGVAASLDVAGSLAIKGVETGGAASGVAASNARVTAEAAAAGIDGGDGVDDIANWAAIAVLPAAEAVGVSGALDVVFKITGEVDSSALSESDVTARAVATGIAGGAGGDLITNRGPIALMKQAVPAIDAEALAVSVSLDVSGTLNGDAKGQALAKATTTAEALATGIDGGAGLDRIFNYDQILGDLGAEVDAVSVGAKVTVTGATGGKATGAALTEAGGLARATATGIDGGGDRDEIVNNGAIDLTTGADSAATAVSVTLSASLVGEAEGKALADGSATALSRSVGIDGGTGHDDITSTAQPTTTRARSSASSQSVSVAVTGAVGVAEGGSVADASAHGDAYAAGLVGGAGVDTIVNESAITSSAAAAATAKSASVAVTFGVGSVKNLGSGNSSANATATAVGIEGGDDGDSITNSGRIQVGGPGTLPMTTATAGSTSVGVSVAVGKLVGAVSSESAARSLASAYGISGGAGDDHIVNSGSITAGTRPPVGLGSLMALATAGSDSVNVAIGIGDSPQSASANAASIATTTVAGLAGGAGKDYLESTGAIESFASAGAVSGGSATKASLTIGKSSGGATSDATSTSTALATGIDGGADDDEILAEGNLTVGAWARTTANSTARDYNILSIGAALQSAVADSSSTALAIARGVFAGTGADQVLVGQLLSPGLTKLAVTSFSEAVSSARASSVTGFSAGAVDQSSRSAAQTTSHALAVGIDGGAGDDHLRSVAAITAAAEAKASSSGTSASSSGFTLAGATKGESVADARTAVTAQAVGIRGGGATLTTGESDADEILNDAPVDVTATASGSSSSTAKASSPITIFGSAEGRATADASAQVLAKAVGIDGGADNDVIRTRLLAGATVGGTIDATAQATASVTSRAMGNANVVFGDASTMGVSDASASIAAEALGVLAGAGDDEVETKADITATANAVGNISATSEVDADVTFGDGSSGALSDSSARKLATAVGIDAGSGDDRVDNHGNLIASTTSGGSVASASAARAKAFFGRASSKADSAASLEGINESKGIVGGDGVDRIRNYGLVDVDADARLNVSSLSVATARSFFSSAGAGATSAANASGSAYSLGIGGDAGDDVIENAGTLVADASATTRVDAMSVAVAKSTFGGTETYAQSSSAAAATAVANGVDGGEGDDTVTIAGPVTVTADSNLTVTAYTLSSDGPAVSDARGVASAQARGVAGGEGRDKLTNRDDILVSALPRILAATRTIGGYVEGRVGTELTADALGMDGGTGDDTLVNSGNVTVLLGAAHSALPAGTPDIALTSITLGGRVNANASAVADVHAAGISGGDGWDSVLNDVGGSVRAAAANFIRMATIEIGANVRADLRTSSAVEAAGIAAEDVENRGSVEAQADTLLRADGAALTIYGLSRNQEGTVSAAAYGIRGSELSGWPFGAPGSLQNLGSVVAGSSAEVRSTNRVTAFFATGGQSLDFAATSLAAGIAAGAGDDMLSNAPGGSIASTAVAVGSIQGVTTTYNLFGIGGRTENLVDARLEATAFGLDLGAGSNQVGNAGSIAASALARPSDFATVGGPGCAPGACVALAVSDVARKETSASADALAVALARGIQGVGDDAVTSSGTIRVTADSLATSFAQAGTILAAEDQSQITDLDRSTPKVFVDESLRGLAEVDLLGKRLRFPGELNLDFLKASSLVTERDAAASTVETLVAQDSKRFVDKDFETRNPGVNPVGLRIRFADAGTGFVSVVTAYDATKHEFTLADAIPGTVKAASAYGLQVPNQFVDASYVGPDPVGLRIRFPSDGGTFVSVVTSFDQATGRFTLGDAIPLAVADRSDFSLSVLAARVIGFDSATGTVTLDASLPGSIGTGETYTFSIVSGVAGSTRFRDDARIGESMPIGTRVTFAEAPGFVAFVTAFDPATGTFTLDRGLPAVVGVHDVYALSVDASDGSSGADANAFSAGIDLTGPRAVIHNTGLIDARASAEARTSVNAIAGTGSAIAQGVAEARGIRTGVGPDAIQNDGVVDVQAVVAAGSSTGVLSQRALAVGVDSGDGDDLVVNRGTIRVTAAPGALATSQAGRFDAIGIQTGAGNDTVLTYGAIVATVGGASGSALAVSTGEGGDLVGLLGASGTGQDIELGEGQDTLLLGAGAVFTGIARADPAAPARLDVDTFTLGGDTDGTFALAEIGASARYRGFDVFRKQGLSTWTIAGDAAMDWVVDEGVLAVQDTLTGTLLTSPVSTVGLIDVLETATVRRDDAAPIVLEGGGGLRNAGQLDVGGTGPDQIGVLVAGDGNAVFNTGTGRILANAQGAGRAVGIRLQGLGSIVINEGEVRAYGPDASSVVLRGEGAVVVNRGLLTSTGPAVRFEGLAGAANTMLNDIGGVIDSVVGPAIMGDDSDDDFESFGTVHGGVALGAGDDRLLIAASSVIFGTADGERGTDTFVLGGGTDATFDLFDLGTRYLGFERHRKEGASRWTVTGSADGPWSVAQGTLLVNGTLRGDVLVEPQGRLGGNGTVGSLVNRGTVAPGNSIGVLHVAGDYLHGAAAILEIEVDGLGNSDRLDVGGTARLEGGAVQVLPAGSFGIATEYTILTAKGGVAGTFDAARSLVGSFDADLDYEPNRVLLTLIRNDFSFASFAATRNQSAVGRALDANKKAAARGDFKPVMDEFLRLTPDEVRVALDALSGELHASAVDSLLRQGDAFLATAIERQASAQEVMEGGRRIWVDAFGRFGSVDWDGNASGADYRSAGVAGGLDVEVTPATRLGLAVGYSRGSTDLDRTGGGEAETDSYHLGLYGEYEDGPWNLRAAGAYSWHDVETERQIRYGRVDRRAEADYDADQFSAYLRAAYSLQAADGSTVQPFASLAYSRLDRPGFRESGADSLNLEVDGETMESLVSTLGVRAIWDREWGKTRVRPELRVGWAHQFLDGFGELTAHLAGAPGRSGYRDFTVRGPQTGRDAMVVGAGLTAEIGKSSRLFLSYDALVNGDRTDQAVVGGIRVTW